MNLSIYRDVWIYCLYTLCTFFSVRVIFGRKNRFRNFILLLPSLWLLGEFRGYALISFLITILVYFTFKKLKALKKPSVYLVLLIIGAGIYYSYFMDFKVPYVNMSLNDVLNYRNYFLGEAAGGSQMWISLDQPFFGTFLINYLHSYIGNLLGPLPWHISGISTLFVFFVETIPMIFILSFLWKKRKLLSPMQKYTLLHSFIWISLIAVSNDNIGTATRLRPVAWILILIVFATVYSKNRYMKINSKPDKDF